jgi:two-component system CheB/CheR fusion protein
MPSRGGKAGRSAANRRRRTKVADAAPSKSSAVRAPTERAASVRRAQRAGVGVAASKRGGHGADPARFPIVALGASAGGLAALEQFFQHVPHDSGMAYVVVTHQAPDRVTLLPELLAKRAAIPVGTVRDGGKLLPNHAYVTPPGHLLTIKDETTRLTPQPKDGDPLLPIDLAFRSLAENEGDHGIAIVLSGNGSDGTLGVAEVKSAFGMVMAQDPRSAQYASMPTNAIATQLVDYVLPPEQMPEQLVRYVRGKRRRSPSAFQLDEGADGTLQKILGALRNRTGHDFRAYKKSTIKRRIERRMHVHAIVDPEEYGRFLEHTAYEVDALFKELLISVTSFFRDPPAFEALEHELARLIDQRGDGHALRIWVAGCATGEEAYSIAILAKEAARRSGKDIKIQVFATDLDQQAVDIARTGRYPEGIAADVSAERLSRFFTREDNGYRVNKDVRELIVFAIQNVVKDPPFTKLDLLSCRNLLIYLESELQKRVLSLFSYALRPDGLMLLGTSEGVSGFDDRFATLDKRWKLFQRSHSSPALPVPDFLADRLAATAGGSIPPLAPDGPRATASLVGMAERVLLGGFVPPSVIVSARGELIYVHGRVGEYFEPAAGEPTQNAFSMAREGLRTELPAVVRQAAANERGVAQRSLQVRSNGGFRPVTLTARRLNEPEALRGNFVVSFDNERRAEAPAKKRSRLVGKSPERVSALEDELRRTHEHLKGTVEELETSNEELKSTNEELQSTNEELQSANEELETSREEMQSLNEELQTVNAELEERNRALSQANDDMQNLLNSTDVATVFLDDKLHIKRFTTQAKKVFSLIDTDIGRPISDLAANLRYDLLVEEAQEVLRTLVFREREIQTKEGHWRLMRIMPYRTHENLIDGLVMTFVDIDRLKNFQRAERQVRAYAEGVVDAMSSSILLLDGELRGVFANRAFHEMFGTHAQRIVGQPLDEIAAWDARDLDAKLRALNEAGESFEIELAKGTPRTASAALQVNARRLPDHPDRPLLLMLSFERVPSDVV